MGKVNEADVALAQAERRRIMGLYLLRLLCRPSGIQSYLVIGPREMHAIKQFLGKEHVAQPAR